MEQRAHALGIRPALTVCLQGVVRHLKERAAPVVRAVHAATGGHQRTRKRVVIQHEVSRRSPQRLVHVALREQQAAVARRGGVAHAADVRRARRANLVRRVRREAAAAHAVGAGSSAGGRGRYAVGRRSRVAADATHERGDGTRRRWNDRRSRRGDALQPRAAPKHIRHVKFDITGVEENFVSTKKCRQQKCRAYNL